MMVHYFKFLLYLIFLIYRCDCAKILSIFHVPSPSLHLAGSTMMEILADRGHDVTMISVMKQKKPTNYREIYLDEIYEQFAKHNENLLSSLNNNFDLFTFVEWSYPMVECVLNHSKFQNFMNSGEHFDVVITETLMSESLMYVAHHFKAPLILFSCIGFTHWTNPYVANPEPPSYVPDIFLPVTSDMSFLERSYNSIVYGVVEIYRLYYHIPRHNDLLHKYYPNAPNLETFIYNVSLVLVNADYSTHEAVPTVPNMVSIGGFHIKKPKPLPHDLQDVLDNAKNGVVYFSLGTNIRSKDIPMDKLKFILKVLSKLKETVLWKFEADNLPGKPENVVIKKWLPQNDVLAHKNVKLFITHGGLYSTMESVCHGVPTLALPVFADQHVNSLRSEKNGYSKPIPFRDLTEENFASALKEILHNPEYKKNAERSSLIMKDKPVSPTDSLIFWVEYIIRHKDAPHLKVAALKLNWIQYLLLDVVLSIVLVLVILIAILKYTLRYLIRLCSVKKKKKE